ncbi:ninein-like [Brienomyrus brachyistius]|uniref:ninein-like n=1 Tax=Brienomyrus brachyistius TaxID=42636 RepID=UPI0020B3CE02|nr:ninein-like [Brienomyrus brachyistius]XP_048830080.1 ninein-like [Brienomyrus brachyistius]
MDETQENEYEEQLKEIFQSFDTSGSGFLDSKELKDLYQALHLEEETAVLIHSLLHPQDGVIYKVDFKQFKDTLIQILTPVGEPFQSQEACWEPDSFVNEGNCFSHWLTPELADSITAFSEAGAARPPQDPRNAVHNNVSRKYQCWDTRTSTIEEYEAQGQLQLWNPDRPNIVQRAALPFTGRLEELLNELFDGTGQSTVTPTSLRSTTGMKLFSSLDDGTGYTQVECVLDAWQEAGIENSTEILEALGFSSVDDKVNLRELATALENELRVTQSGIHQAVLASFRAEIQYLLEQLDVELSEKKKLRGDLEKAGKLTTKLTTEVDEHLSAIEHNYNLNIRKLEQEYNQKLASVRAELTKERDIIHQQATQQHEELDGEIEKIKQEATLLREHLALGAKENSRLEAQLLDSTEKLLETENLVCKLQRKLDNILEEKFNYWDRGSADFFLHEEHLRQIFSKHEEQCREMQDCIDELQSELEKYHAIKKIPLIHNVDNNISNIFSDQGLYSGECQSLNMSLEAEILVENLKEQHLEEIKKLREQLESEISEYQQQINKQRIFHEEQQKLLSLKCQEEVQTLQGNISQIQDRADELQCQVNQKEMLQIQLESSQEKVKQHEEEMSVIKKQLSDTQAYSDELKEKLKTLELQSRMLQSFVKEKEELLRIYEERTIQVEQHHKENIQALIKVEREKLQAVKEEMEQRLIAEWDREKAQLQETHEHLLQANLEEERQKLERKLKEEWAHEKALLEEQHAGVIQVFLDKKRLRLLNEQKQAERKLVYHWEKDRAAGEEERIQQPDSPWEAMQEIIPAYNEERKWLGGLMNKFWDETPEARQKLEKESSEKMLTNFKNQIRADMQEMNYQPGSYIKLCEKEAAVQQPQNRICTIPAHKSIMEQFSMKKQTPDFCTELSASQEKVEQEIKMMKMEQHMQDVELKLHNIKLLMQEKVFQLNTQLPRNNSADMIKDLDIENTQLQKKVDKNYLLRENISYLKKIVYNLNPSPHMQSNTTVPVLDMKS